MFGVMIVIIAWLELSLIICLAIYPILSHILTLDIMADLESNHGDESNLNNENFHAYQPIRTLKIICNLLGVVHHHASFFQLMQIILILSLV